MKNKKNVSKIITSTLFFIAVIIAVIILFNILNKPKTLNFSGVDPKDPNSKEPYSFTQLFDKQEITEISFKDNKIYFNIKAKNNNNSLSSATLLKPYAYRVVGDPSLAWNYMQKNNQNYANTITINFKSASNIGRYISSGLSILLLIIWVILIVGMFKGGAASMGGIGNFNKTKAKLTNNINVKFTDVAGAEEEKEELKEIVQFLKNPKKYHDIGAIIPKGVLLVGPPGTGKTLFAKAIAGEAGVPFYTTSGSDFTETFVGTGAARVRDLFEQAKNNAPCIIFIDEIDALGKERSSSMSGNDETLNQLLVQMDGFETTEKTVIIIAATNRQDVLDPALLRSGRFSRQIYVALPDVKGREDIFRVHARNKPLASNISFKILSRMTSGFSGADIANILNEAAMRAVRENRNEIIMVDILESINRIVAGPKKLSRVITEKDKRITAYHECGHAIVAKILGDGCEDVQEISVIPRGDAAGYTITRPNNDDLHMNKTQLNNYISMLLGGRAAEQVVIGDITTGASNDIERATKIATSMVTEWGMSEKIGIINLSKNNDSVFNKSPLKETSQKISEQADAEIKKILQHNFERSIQILESRRALLDSMVELLFKCDTIYTNEINMLIEGKSPEEVYQYIQEKTLELGTDIPRVDAVENKSKDDNN